MLFNDIKIILLWINQQLNKLYFQLQLMNECYFGEIFNNCFVWFFFLIIDYIIYSSKINTKESFTQFMINHDYINSHCIFHQKQPLTSTKVVPYKHTRYWQSTLHICL